MSRYAAIQGYGGDREWLVIDSRNGRVTATRPSRAEADREAEFCNADAAAELDPLLVKECE